VRLARRTGRSISGPVAGAGEKMRDPDRTSLLSLAIDPKTPDDGRRLADGFRRLTVDDLALRVRIGAVPGQLVIGATSEQHLEVTVITTSTRAKQRSGSRAHWRLSRLRGMPGRFCSNPRCAWRR